MKDVYKMTVRFDLTDTRERNLAEFMQTLDVKKYQSRNQADLTAKQSRKLSRRTSPISERKSAFSLMN